MFERVRKWFGLQQRGSYSDDVINAILQQAGGTSIAEPDGVAAAQFAAGLYGSAFASADVVPANGRTDVLTPELLGMVGRQLVLRGEAVFVIDVDGGALSLLPAATWEITGASPVESNWRYAVELAMPNGKMRKRTLPSESVLHFRHLVDPTEPWQGKAPLTRAGLSAELAARIEHRLSQEAGTTTAYVLPLPAGGNDASVSALKTDLKTANGRLLTVETTQQGQGRGREYAPMKDWQTERLGFDPPQWLTVMRKDVHESVLVACGVPPALVAPGDGAAQRESWRRLLHGGIAPLGRLVAAEASRKLETSLTLDFARLHASDITGRARAFASLVAAGMQMTDAEVFAGLLTAEEAG